MKAMPTYALIIIDMQKAYFRSPALEKQRNQLTAMINQLVEKCDEQHIPCFNLVTEHERDKSTWTLNMLEDNKGFLFRGQDEVDTVDGLELCGAITLKKTRDSAFFRTDLYEQLKENGVDTIVICGVSTHSCVFMTAAEAYASNLKVMLVEDATASHDPAFHNTTFALLEKEYRQHRKSTAEMLAILSKK